MSTKLPNAFLISVIFAICILVPTNRAAANRASENGGTGLLLVANKADHTLGIVDPDSAKQIAVIPVGGVTGHEVAASSDGRTAWVPIYGDSGVGLPGTDGRTISVIDLTSRSITKTIDLGAPSRPHSAVFNAITNRLYVTTEVTNSIKVIDATNNTLVDSIPTKEPQSHMLAVSSDATRGYTANVNTGTVSAIDLTKKQVITVIPVAKAIQRIAISVDGRWVFTSDQTKPELDVIDTTTNKVSSRLAMRSTGYGLASTHDGQKLIIAHPEAGLVSILDLHSMKIEQVVRVPKAPQEVLVRPDDRMAYVSCDASKQIAAIDLSTFKVERLIDVGAGADGLAWAPAMNQAGMKK